MTQKALYDKYKVWSKKINRFPYREDLGNSIEVVSYDAGSTDSTRSGITVRVIGAHTDKLHLFIFAEKTTWDHEQVGEDEKELAHSYRMILAF